MNFWELGHPDDGGSGYAERAQDETKAKDCSFKSVAGLNSYKRVDISLVDITS